jgi:large subunit ribosomal protein L21e
MAQKSHGSRHGTRKKFSKDGDTTLTVNDRMKTFEEGERVLVQYHHSVQRGRSHSRFHGRHGTITGTRGDAYVVEITDGKTDKEIYIKPVHLQEVEN